MFETPWIAALAALFLWWSTTGLLLWRVHAADRGGRGQHLWSVILSLPLLVGGVLGVNGTLGDGSPQGVWFAFLSALALWGWVELAFLSGIITGPNTRPCPQGLAPLARFSAAFGTVAFHEIVLAGIFAALAVAAYDSANPFAFWTFFILFAARISAKLNLFLGVPRINTDFLPSPLAHLSSYFRESPVSGFFPLSVTLLTIGTGYFLARLWHATTLEDDGRIIGFTLLSMLAALALLEHWFMVWRVRDDKLWRWMIPAANTQKPKI
ncbi:putative photosynthetic complex assembly protein PuhE [Roseinatronobacter sp. NSM]|uniref:putative photosynthetic complex assembly protein PuhE n=1 Tax=Roseinatronobacter sp. NSM TaxID=3457785 RepID=UPI004036877D